MSSGVLILLVLRNQVVEVTLRLRELHFIHALPCVPVEESLAPEHQRELLTDPPEDLLNGRVVADEGGGHLEASGWDVTHCHFDIMGDPVHKVVVVSLLHRKHLLINLLGGHPASEHAGHCEVAAVPWVTRRHHVAGVEHLLGELRHGEGPILLAATGRQGGKPRHEEVEAWERHHVDRQLSQVGVELSGKPQRGGDPAHGHADQVVEVPVGGRGELQRAEADVVEGLVVDAEGLIRVLQELVDRQGGVVRLDYGVGHFGGGHDAEGIHDAVRVLLPDLVDDERPHAGAGATTQGVDQLESLQAVAALALIPHPVNHLLHQLCSLSVVTLCPVVPSSGVPCNTNGITKELHFFISRLF